MSVHIKSWHLEKHDAKVCKLYNSQRNKIKCSLSKVQLGKKVLKNIKNVEKLVLLLFAKIKNSFSFSSIHNEVWFFKNIFPNHLSFFFFSFSLHYCLLCYVLEGKKNWSSTNYNKQHKLNKREETLFLFFIVTWLFIYLFFSSLKE